uniref:Uncharacterized protein n=1 Tax=Anguilla anguilla TaxID=7936 RepID=A0A0E9X479_ANGAN
MSSTSEGWTFPKFTAGALNSPVWISFTFFCPFLGLPSSSEFFTFDRVRATFFSLGPRDSLFFPCWRWSHSRCSQSASPLGLLQSGPSLCLAAGYVCPTISYVCIASCTLSSPNSLHLL